MNANLRRSKSQQEIRKDATADLLLVRALQSRINPRRIYCEVNNKNGKPILVDFSETEKIRATLRKI